MPSFYVNKNAQNNGDHEVHETNSDCSHHADLANRHDLGNFSSCKGAVQEAKRLGYKKANGCYYCCNDCHTS